jgi:hypothetical protein
MKVKLKTLAGVDVSLSRRSPHRPAASSMASNPTSSASPARYKDALIPRRFSNNSSG